MGNVLLDLLSLESDPEEVAIIDKERTITRRELWDQARILAGLITETVPACRRVGLHDTRDAFAVVNIIASVIAGRSIVMLPPDDPDTMARLAASSACEVVLVGDEIRQRTWTVTDEAIRDPGLGVAEAGSAEAVVLFTSGTTREPRGVRISLHNLAVNLTAMLRLTTPWRSDDRFGLVLALTHSFGLSMILMSLARRRPIVILDGGLPNRATTELAATNGVSIIGCVPYYLRLVARRRLVLGSSFVPNLRSLFLAGGGVTDDERRRSLGDFAGETYLMYGFTEATARVALRREGDGAPADSVGLPLPGTFVRVVAEDGEQAPVGTIGVIQVNSPSLMLGYLGESPRPAGEAWTTTDLGRIDEAGNLFITGRQAEMLNFRGNRVSAVSVEAVVTGIDGIRDARLIPEGQDEDSQCELRVIAATDADPRRLRREILRVVTPRGLVREVAFVDHLEFTRSGKPLRRS